MNRARVVRRFATRGLNKINHEMNESIADADAPRARPDDALRVGGCGSVLVAFI